MPIDGKTLLNSAIEYLLRCGATPEMISQQRSQWKSQRKNAIVGREGIYHSLLNHAKNRQGMPNAIGDIDQLETVLFGFSPQEVMQQYKTWQQLLEAIQNSGISIPGRIDPSNPKNFWVIYAKSVISCAGFMASFVSAEAFHKFVEGFYSNELSKLALPLLLKEELFGFGLALACDFLKENGYPEFVKPDVHINDITRGLGITNATTDFGVFKDVVSYCHRNDLVPYELDKILWLVGSGSFYLSGQQVKTDKGAFVRQILAGSKGS